MSKVIAESEQASLFVVELGALLHDIADAKFHDGNEELGPNKATVLLNTLGVETTVIKHVENIIRHISFKCGNEKHQFMSLEMRIVKDAYRLDAIGNWHCTNL